MVRSRGGGAEIKRTLIEALSLVRSARHRLRYWILRMKGGRVKDPRPVEDLIFLDYVLELIEVRLGTLLVTGAVTGDLLMVPIESIRRLSREMNIPPDIQYAIDSVNDALTSLHVAMIGAHNHYYVDEDRVSSMVEDVLREARIMARKRASST